MSPVILLGVIAINVALISYTVGAIAVHRGGRATTLVLRAFSLAAICDISATACMIAGSRGRWLTLHGSLGYLALAVMISVVARLWRLRRQGADMNIPPGLRTGLRFAYAGWLVAYTFGVALAAGR